MSWQALAWAAKQRVACAADKLILIAYAERCNDETGCAYPSLAWLEEFSSLDRKTVVKSIKRLCSAKLIEDTGERAGRTKQVKIYRVLFGTVPKTEPPQKRNSSVFPGKETQKRNPEPSREPIPQEALLLSGESADAGVAPPIRATPEQVVEAFNAMAARAGLSKMIKFTTERRRKLQARLRDSTIDEFTEAICAIERSSFCRGENDRGWRADFDFLLQPKSFARLIEGAYDDGR